MALLEGKAAQFALPAPEWAVGTLAPSPSLERPQQAMPPDRPDQPVNSSQQPSTQTSFEKLEQSGSRQPQVEGSRASENLAASSEPPPRSKERPNALNSDGLAEIATPSSSQEGKQAPSETTQQSTQPSRAEAPSGEGVSANVPDQPTSQASSSNSSSASDTHSVSKQPDFGRQPPQQPGISAGISETSAASVPEPSNRAQVQPTAETPTAKPPGVESRAASITKPAEESSAAQARPDQFLKVKEGFSAVPSDPGVLSEPSAATAELPDESQGSDTEVPGPPQPDPQVQEPRSGEESYIEQQEASSSPPRYKIYLNTTLCSVVLNLHFVQDRMRLYREGALYNL